MWLPERTSTLPGRSVYRLKYRSTNGAQLYPLPGQLLPIPDFTNSRELLDSAYGGHNRQFRSCQHYRVDKTVIADCLAGLVQWHTPGNPSQGYWLNTPLPSHSIWDGGHPPLVSGNVSPVAVFGPWTDPFLGLPPLFIENIAGKGIPDPVGLSDLINDSLVSMLPGIKPELSLLNTLFELKDWKTLLRTIDRVKAALATFVIRGPKPLRTLLRGTSDVYLQSQFNVLPLLSDLTSINAALRSVSKNLKWLKANAGKRLTTHYGRTLSNAYVDGTYTLDSLFDTVTTVTSKIQSRRFVRYTARSFNATLDYAYSIRNLSGLSDEAAALLDALGVNLNPSIIWNAMRWTFVVDWVIGVSRWLDQFKVRNIEPATNIYQYCWSYKISREIVTSMGFETVRDAQRITETAYKRVVVVPDYVRAFKTSGLNSREFSLAAALGFSRL
jgi:hypothetical protein